MGGFLLMALLPAMLAGFALTGGGDDTDDDAPEGPPIPGTEGNDALVGTPMSEYVDAGHGDDEVLGGAGNDTLRGNLGADVLADFAGKDQLFGGYGTDDLAALDAAGTNAPDLLDGGASDDFLLGDDGDTLIGGAGNDLFSIGWLPGNAAVTVTDFGTLSETEASGADEGFGVVMDATHYTPDTPFLLTPTTGGVDLVYGKETMAHFEGAEVGDLDGRVIMEVWGTDGVFTLTPVVEGTSAPQSLVGTDGADALTGDTGNDTLSGAAGNDTLRGEDGNDTLMGDAGNDSLMGGTGNDIITDPSTGLGNDTLRGEAGKDQLYDLLGDNLLDGGDGNDLILATENIQFTPSAGGDTLLGGAGNDTLIGDGGDLLTGGAGVDTFMAASDSVDPDPIRVTDFNVSEDVLELATLTSAPGVVSTLASGTGTLVSLDGRPMALIEGLTPAQLPEGSIVVKKY